MSFISPVSFIQICCESVSCALFFTSNIIVNVGCCCFYSFFFRVLFIRMYLWNVLCAVNVKLSIYTMLALLIASMHKHINYMHANDGVMLDGNLYWLVSANSNWLWKDYAAHSVHSRKSTPFSHSSPIFTQNLFVRSQNDTFKLYISRKY